MTKHAGEIPTSEGELERLADLVAERIAARLGATELVDKHELAKRVSLSVPTIERAVKFGTIPCEYAGSKRLFDVPKVIAAIKLAGKNLTPPRESI